jgi:hypothetical protein
LKPPRKHKLADGTEANTLWVKITHAIDAVATEVRYTDAPD